MSITGHFELLDGPFMSITGHFEFRTSWPLFSQFSEPCRIIFGIASRCGLFGTVPFRCRTSSFTRLQEDFVFESNTHPTVLWPSAGHKFVMETITCAFQFLNNSSCRQSFFEL